MKKKTLRSAAVVGLVLILVPSLVDRTSWDWKTALELTSALLTLIVVFRL